MDVWGFPEYIQKDPEAREELYACNFYEHRRAGKMLGYKVRVKMDRWKNKT